MGRVFPGRDNTVCRDCHPKAMKYFLGTEMRPEWLTFKDAWGGKEGEDQITPRAAGHVAEFFPSLLR